MILAEPLVLRIFFVSGTSWDIRPNNDQFVILRTNLRYVPALNLKVAAGKTVSFEQLEFNFIQAVFHFR